MHLAEVGLRNAGGKMVESLEISNFRCFRHVKLSNLGWLNVVVGRNSSGKTALLESIFLACARDPGVAVRLRIMRGMGIAPGATAQAVVESLWADLFYDFNYKDEIFIDVKGTGNHNRSLRITHSPQGIQAQVNIRASSEQAPSQINLPVVFEWQQGNEQPFVARPFLVGDNVTLPQQPSLTFEAHFFATNIPLPAEQNATLFSELSRQNKEDKVISSIRELFPFIEDIVVAAGGNAARLDAKIAGHQVKLPLGLVSAGVTKLISILLAMASAEGGIIIVDEIENGFYYDTLPLVWKTIRKACKDYNVQLFASTHSLECLEAAASAAHDQVDDFTLIQTQKANGTSNARRVSGRHFVDAIEEDIEVR